MNKIFYPIYPFVTVYSSGGSLAPPTLTLKLLCCPLLADLDVGDASCLPQNPMPKSAAHLFTDYQ